jgi:hypothetical protein
MNSWIRTDWRFPIHAARFTADWNELREAAYSPMGCLLMHAMGAGPEAQSFVLEAGVGLIVEHRPELKGGQLLGIQQDGWKGLELLYAHPALPAWESGGKPQEMVLIPVRGNGMASIDSETGFRRTDEIKPDIVGDVKALIQKYKEMA